MPIRKIIYIILFLILNTSLSFAQNSDIKKITISDTLLYKTVKNFIANRKNESAKFKKFGYINLTLKYYNSQANSIDLMSSYSIVDQYFSLDSGYLKYPKYYTYIENRLILIYDYWSAIFDEKAVSKRDKKKLGKKINKTLDKTEHIVAKDKTGKVVIDDKNFRSEESINIHGGITLNIYKNKKTEIIKNYNSHD
jgi:DNA integrity scanning protein DisA with diadenylate cyclase activity